MTTHVEGEPMTEQEPTAPPPGASVSASEPASGGSGHPGTVESAQGPSDWAKLIALLDSAYTTAGVAIWLDSRNRLLGGTEPMYLGGTEPMYLIANDRISEVIAVAERMVGLTWQEVTS